MFREFCVIECIPIERKEWIMWVQDRNMAVLELKIRKLLEKTASSPESFILIWQFKDSLLNHPLLDM